MDIIQILILSYQDTAKAGDADDTTIVRDATMLGKKEKNFLKEKKEIVFHPITPPPRIIVLGVKPAS